VIQKFDWDCGAAAAMTVGQFFGVGPETADEYIAALGTNPQDGTRASRIEGFLRGLGLAVYASDGLQVQDLCEYTRRGFPVICCIQDWEDNQAQVVSQESGHYVVVSGVSERERYVTVHVQDPVCGPRDLDALDFLARWHDYDRDKDYVHYGICVGSK